MKLESVMANLRSFLSLPIDALALRRYWLAMPLSANKMQFVIADLTWLRSRWCSDVEEVTQSASSCEDTASVVGRLAFADRSSMFAAMLARGRAGTHLS